jgi:hypothetical protein
MTSLVETLYSLVGTPTSPVEAIVLYTGAVIFSFVLLTYGLRLLSIMVKASAGR